ncbi:benenodin family lasso peptide [Sphingobium terrigena]|jgi:hypothetical protein|uniref:Benenodin family lasso peptide n=1 Tax=Sphingobium terrigena TaxID=2304063 RepID=A0A418YPC6_9SPHN|nr:benenodin family lasso peptide [Sphingobium terrigena]RJG53165.1 benenodin family lasso peptide [Sphingobium terrigena]
MDRANSELDQPIIDLGSVVTETKGANKGGPDTFTLPMNQSGISDD